MTKKKHTPTATAMAALDFDFEALCKTKNPELQVTAARVYGEKKFLSGIAAFLPTQGVPDTEELFQQNVAGLAHDSQRFANFINTPNAAGEALSIALYWKNLIDVLIEVTGELGEQTREIKLDKNRNPQTDIIDLDDGLEPGNDPNIRASAAVRGPFQFLPHFRDCTENNFPMAVPCGGCATVIKEFRGLQLRRVLRRITKVVEPWFSRRRIIYQWVWVLEWVPVEVIKTITAKCSCDNSGPVISKRVVLDRELINFWRCR